MTTLVEKVLAVEAALREADVPHAFGGALALAFHIAEPRGTRDIDVNVFVGAPRASAVFGALPAEVAWGDGDVQRVDRDGQVRLFWDDTPVDVFFSTHAFHVRAAEHVEQVPFSGELIPVLGASELAVFKAFFDRTKDWADIEAMIDAKSLDVHAVLGWLVDLLGSDDSRVERYRDVMARAAPDREPRFDP
jgi:hypothetical protein